MNDDQYKNDAARARFRSRLRKAVAQTGLAGDIPTALQHLGGFSYEDAQVLWAAEALSLPHLQLVSEALRIPMRHWFDEEEPPLSWDTYRASSLAGEEDLVLRLEEGSQPGEAAAGGLVHYRARQSMGFGIEAGDSVVACRAMPVDGPRAGRLHLYESNDEFKVLLCVTLEGRRLLRSTQENSAPFIAPRSSSDEGREFTCGEVVAVIRAGDLPHARAVQAWNASRSK